VRLRVESWLRQICFQLRAPLAVYRIGQRYPKPPGAQSFASRQKWKRQVAYASHVQALLMHGLGGKSHSSGSKPPIEQSLDLIVAAP
jgi:hypothetical protein